MLKTSTLKISPDEHGLPHDLIGLASLPPQQDVNLLLDPVLVIGGVRVGGLLIHQAREVSQLKQKIYFIKETSMTFRAQPGQ